MERIEGSPITALRQGGMRNPNVSLYGSSPRRTAQTAIWALEPNPNLLRMLRTWLWTVRSETESSEEIWRFVSPRPTKTATSRSRRVRGSSGVSTRDGLRRVRGVVRAVGGSGSLASKAYSMA